MIPVLIGAVALVLTFAGLAAWALLRSPGGAGASPTTTSAPTPQAPPTFVIETHPAVSYEEPTPEDFSVTLKITKKKCFGSAGCNVTYHIEVVGSDVELDPSKTYQVTYEVTGVEDGPAINTFEITGDDYTYDQSELGSTPSSSTKLKVKVTDVEET